MSQLFLCGSFSGIANSVLSGPIEHIRTRLQIQTDSSQGPSNLIRSIYRNYGFSGIYKGQMITLAREFFGYGIYFATYEALIQRTMGLEGKKRSDIQAWKQCLFGALSGYCLWTVIYPIDVIKSKLQTDNLDPLKRSFSSSMDCFKKTLANDGIAGLYRGFLPCMLRAGPVNAATFLAYEVTMNYIARS
jgi:solute carrier family 25 carnitine/acylcarnitine transporter 20/29